MTDRVFYDPTAFDDMRDPGGWYFWDKEGKWFYGPYASEKEARRTLARFQKDGMDA